MNRDSGSRQNRMENRHDRFVEAKGSKKKNKMK